MVSGPVFAVLMSAVWPAVTGLMPVGTVSGWLTVVPAVSVPGSGDSAGGGAPPRPGGGGGRRGVAGGGGDIRVGVPLGRVTRDRADRPGHASRLCGAGGG